MLGAALLNLRRRDTRVPGFRGSLEPQSRALRTRIPDLATRTDWKPPAATGPAGAEAAVVRTGRQQPRPLPALRSPWYLQAARRARCLWRLGPAVGRLGLRSSGSEGGLGLLWAQVLVGVQSSRFFPALVGAAPLEPLVFCLPAGF